VITIFPSSPPYIWNKSDITDEVERTESVSVRKFWKGILHRDPSPSADRLGKCLTVLDCRGGIEIHLHTSLFHNSACSLGFCITPSNLAIIPFIFLHLSKSIIIFSLSQLDSFFLYNIPFLPYLWVYFPAIEKRSQVLYLYAWVAWKQLLTKVLTFDIWFPHALWSNSSMLHIHLCAQTHTHIMRGRTHTLYGDVAEWTGFLWEWAISQLKQQEKKWEGRSHSCHGSSTHALLTKREKTEIFSLCAVQYMSLCVCVCVCLLWQISQCRGIDQQVCACICICMCVCKCVCMSEKGECQLCSRLTISTNLKSAGGQCVYNTCFGGVLS